MNMYRCVCGVIIVVLLGGCAVSPKISDKNVSLVPPPALLYTETTNNHYVDNSVEAIATIRVQQIGDIARFPQNMDDYVQQYGEDKNETYGIQKSFEGRYYRPWRYTTVPISAKEASWAVNAYNGGYGSNLQPIPKEWFAKMREQSDFKSFGTVGKPAVALRWMNVRVLPTQKPLYKDPSKPGNGYPFDMLQNNSVSFNEPLFLSHYSLDGSWAYVFSNNASGWVESNGVSLISHEQIDFLENKEKLFIVEDGAVLRDKQNKFVTYSRIGMALSFSEENNESFSALYVDATGSVKELVVPKQSAHRGVRLINKNDLAKIGNQLLKNTYGWGEMFEERDCSSMIRDYMAPFGIWLPRNSAQQAKKGEIVSLKDMNNSQKLITIREKGIPFETIIYKKGHVLLYVGTVDDTVMVMHNIWGIRTKDKMGVKGRVIIGRAVVSSLELGKEVENFDFDNMLLSTITSMNIFTHTPQMCSKKEAKKPKL